MESDPIGLDGGNNSYVYAGQLPTMLTDPEGLLIPGAAIPYAKCIVECLAVEGAIAKLSDDACYTFTGSAGNCSVSCLNPLNWIDPARVLGVAAKAAKGTGKAFSREKQALIDMAEADRRRGVTRADMTAYSDLNRGLPDPFDPRKVRVDNGHPTGGPHSRVPHGHVGPVDHIPIMDP